MRLSRRVWTDEQVEEILGALLREGVLLAAAIVLIGASVYLRKYGSITPNYRMFRGEPEDLRRIAGIVSAALALRGRGLIQFGLLLLIATPVARVVFSAFAFACQRDYTYVTITLIVLA